VTVTPSGYVRRLMGRRWSPWAEAGKNPRIQIRLAELPEDTGGGACARRGDKIWIYLDRRLAPRERTAILAHELVHLERGGSRCRPANSMMSDLVIREEIVVDRIVAERLLPLDDLERFCECRAEINGIAPWEVADEFDVPEWVAMEGLASLALRRARRSA
jgi:hypothetical protein